jgi:tetratricopeptide (TPR) repeat protein/transcriptional regulator with XRE-family HTH domain
MSRSFAELLADYMSLAGVSVDELARELGVERSTILRWRTGQTKRPRYRDNVLRCANVLKLTPEEADLFLASVGYRPEHGTLAVSEVEWTEPGPTPTNIPRSYVDLFVGRKHELGEVLGPWLSKEAGVRAIAVTGIGGIGKTALVVAAALRFQAEFPGGMVFLTARDNPGFGLEALFLAMDEALGTQLRYQDPEVRSALARARLNGSRHLLVLDNLETAPLESIAGIIAFLCTLDVQEAGTLTLMTGRDMPEPFLDLAPRHHVPLGSLEQKDAITLLQHLAADTLGTPHELEGQWSQVAEQCYGHPLLIRLVVGLIQYEGWQTVQQRMQALSGGVGERVDALLSESVARLSTQHSRAQKVLWSLGAFSGGATLEAVSCVQQGIDLPPRDEALPWNKDGQSRFLKGIETGIRCVAEDRKIFGQVSEALGLLCRGRLVERVGDRYDLHPLVCSYIRERGWAASEEAGRAVQQAHAAYFLRYVFDNDEDFRALERELGNIRAGFAFADSSGNERMVFLYAWRMDAFLDLYGYWEEDLRWLAEWAEACEVLGDIEGLFSVYNNMGLVYSNLGNYSLAMEFYQKALGGKEKAGAKDSSLADTYCNIGGLYFGFGDFDQALTWLQKGLEIDERLGNEERLCASHNNIGMVHQAHGAYDEALAWFQKGLALAEKLGDQAKMALGYNNIGMVHQARGAYDEALAWFQKGLALAEKIGDQSKIDGIKDNIESLSSGRIVLADSLLSVVSRPPNNSLEPTA